MDFVVFVSHCDATDSKFGGDRLMRMQCLMPRRLSATRLKKVLANARSAGPGSFEGPPRRTIRPPVTLHRDPDCQTGRTILYMQNSRFSLTVYWSLRTFSQDSQKSGYEAHANGLHGE